jgi:hypothetical protein
MWRGVVYGIYQRLRTCWPGRRHFPVIRNANQAGATVHEKRALVIWVVKPFLLDPTDPSMLYHQNARQCRQVTRLLGDFRFTVDVVHVGDRSFRPAQPYDLVISNRSNLDDLGSSAFTNAITIYLATTLHHKTHNRNLQRRHDALRERRQCDVRVRRRYSELVPFALQSNAIVVFGNAYTADTWRQTYDGPIYPFNNYGFAETNVPDAPKNFPECRKNFLFFASARRTSSSLPAQARCRRGWTCCWRFSRDTRIFISTFAAASKGRRTSAPAITRSYTRRPTCIR